MSGNVPAISDIMNRISQIENRFDNFGSNPAGLGDTIVDPSSFSQYLQQMQGPTSPYVGGATNFNPLDPNQAANPLGANIFKIAATHEGKQYWPNACAYAVNNVLKQIGVDITKDTKGNPNWVPNYKDLGKQVNSVNDLRPGDLVIYNNAIGQGGYDHIGIYAGNGMAYNVSTSAGYKFVKTSIGSRFQEGRRLGSI